MQGLLEPSSLPGQPVSGDEQAAKLIEFRSQPTNANIHATRQSLELEPA